MLRCSRPAWLSCDGSQTIERDCRPRHTNIISVYYCIHISEQLHSTRLKSCGVPYTTVVVSTASFVVAREREIEWEGERARGRESEREWESEREREWERDSLRVCESGVSGWSHSVVYVRVGIRPWTVPPERYPSRSPQLNSQWLVVVLCLPPICVLYASILSECPTVRVINIFDRRTAVFTLTIFFVFKFITPLAFASWQQPISVQCRREDIVTIISDYFCCCFSTVFTSLIFDNKPNEKWWWGILKTHFGSTTNEC